MVNVMLGFCVKKILCGPLVRVLVFDKGLEFNVKFYIAFDTVQVIPRVVGRAEETSTYSLLGFCTVNYQLSHLRPCRELNPGLRGGR